MISTDKWTELEPMQVRRSGFTASEMNDQIYVFGGQHEELHALDVNKILNLDLNTTENMSSSEIGNTKSE